MRKRKVRRARRVRSARRVRRARRVRVKRNPMIKRYRRKRYVKRHWRRSAGRLRRRRNPIAIGGRRGRFELIPSMKTLQAAAEKGAGAVAAEVVRGTVYSFLGRVSGSVAEDVLGRLASGAVTGMLAGYLLGKRFADAVVEGTYTVTMFQLVADAVALATGGAPKIAGVIANPFTSVPTKPLLPGVGFAAGMPAGMSGLFGVVPERNILPLGGVIPEGDITPLGQDEIPARLRSRF